MEKNARDYFYAVLRIFLLFFFLLPGKILLFNDEDVSNMVGVELE